MLHDPVRQSPFWVEIRERLQAARRIAYDRLSDDEKSIVQDEQHRRLHRARESRSRRRQRQTARVDEARLISGRVLAGAKLEEIAEDLRCTPIAAGRRAQRLGLSIPSRVFARRLFAWVSDDQVEALDRLAVNCGRSRLGTLERLLDFALADDASIARRVLHVSRKD